MSEIPATANRQIARAAGTVMAAFVLSNLTGLVRQVLVMDAFGTHAAMEAFNAANRVSETLFSLAAGGALSSAFIPTFTGLLAREDRKTAWRLASAIANLALLVLIVLSALAWIFAPQVVRYLLASGFAADPTKEALTVELLRLMLPSAVLFGLSGLVMGILNSHQVFWIPALTPSMYQLGMIFGVLVLSRGFGMGIYGLGWGVIIGAALHLLLQVPALLKLKGVYIPTFGLKLPAVREVGWLMGPRLLGVAVVQLNFWVNTWLASYMPEGSVTAVQQAFTLMLMPQAAIAQSIAIAAMPTFSAQYALGKLDEMRHALAASLRGALLLAIPASLGLMLLRRPLIAMLYQHGAFDAHSTDLVSAALLWYAAGLVGHSLVEILSRAFYALHDTRTPVFVGVGAMSLNVVFSLAFSQLFTRLGWMPHGGLALANSTATALEAAGLWLLMRRRLGGLEGQHVLAGVAQALLAVLAMGIVVWGWMYFFASRSNWFIALGGAALGTAVFGLAAWLLGVNEIKSVLRFAASRMGVKRK